MDKPPSPEELRREYLVQEQIKDVRRVAKRQRFVKRWVWVSAVIGLAASVNNSFGVTYAGIAHFVFSGAAGYGLLYYKRGHLTGMAVVGLGNEVISVLAGFFNPFGLLGFCVAGAIIGLGLRIEEDLQ